MACNLPQSSKFNSYSMNGTFFCLPPHHSQAHLLCGQMYPAVVSPVCGQLRYILTLVALIADVCHMADVSGRHPLRVSDMSARPLTSCRWQFTSSAQPISSRIKIGLLHSFSTGLKSCSPRAFLVWNIILNTFQIKSNLILIFLYCMNSCKPKGHQVLQLKLGQITEHTCSILWMKI
jgi:hypothetical protein